MTAHPLMECDGQLRLPVSEILAEHCACVTWAQAGRAIRKGVEWHDQDRKARIARLMAPHADVIKAATACVAGRGHH
jgi:hypothetical protein